MPSSSVHERNILCHNPLVFQSTVFSTLPNTVDDIITRPVAIGTPPVGILTNSHQYPSPTAALFSDVLREQFVLTLDRGNSKG
jgi:hypothetical protein